MSTVSQLDRQFFSRKKNRFFCGPDLNMRSLGFFDGLRETFNVIFVLIDLLYYCERVFLTPVCW